MVGLFEPVCAPWKIDGIPSDFSFGELPPDWEVLEVRGDSTEVSCDNLTEAEARQMADMWSRKRDEAEAEG